MNITDPLTASAQDTPNAAAILTPEGALSWAALDRAVRWTAHAFRTAGLATGNVVAVDLPRQPQHLVAALALARIGVAQIAFDRADPPALRQDFVHRLGIAALIAEHTPRTGAGFAVVAPPPGDIRALSALPAPSFDSAGADGEALPLFVLRTSGTSTGVPKLARLTQAAARARIATKGFLLPEGPGTRYLALGSLNLNSVKSRAFHCVLSGGCIAFADGVTDPRALVAFIRDHDIGYLSCSASRASALLELATGRGPLLPRLAALRIGATMVPQPLREAIRAQLTPNLFIAYGITETGTVSIAPPALVRDVPGTVGLPTPGTEADVIGEDGRPLPAGTAGRLRIRTPGMIHSYLDAPADAARAFRDGWFYSGDLAEFTRDGALIHHGRIDDMMIFDGINISPAEIEGALAAHPAVAEAAGFSIPDPVHGEMPLAAVVVRCAVAEDDLLAHCRARLGPHAPTGLMIVPALPRNAGGKVMKAALQAAWRSHDGAAPSRRTPDLRT